MTVQIVVGGQYGSEGKGAFVNYLALGDGNEPYVVVVRTGGPNAGHSIKYPDPRSGTVYKMQQVPCGWGNLNAKLVLGPGSVIDEIILTDEMIWVERNTGKGMTGRLFIDPNAVVINRELDRGAEQNLVSDIGSTGEGVGSATARKVMRRAQIARDIPWLQRYLTDVPKYLSRHLLDGTPIIVESTQGFGLSLTRSGNYPKVTSRDLTPAQIMNDAGLPHDCHPEVIAVFRTHPIRVAGSSGPMRYETDWETLKKETDGYINAERTTVTNKIRRVSRWDPSLAADACSALHPDSVYLSFYDYLRPDLADREQLREADGDLSDAMALGQDLSAPIRWIGTGFGTIVPVNLNSLL